jgi:hypothetical protein
MILYMSDNKFTHSPIFPRDLVRLKGRSTQTGGRLLDQ